MDLHNTQHEFMCLNESRLESASSRGRGVHLQVTGVSTVQLPEENLSQVPDSGELFSYHALANNDARPTELSWEVAYISVTVQPSILTAWRPLVRTAKPARWIPRPIM